MPRSFLSSTAAAICLAVAGVAAAQAPSAASAPAAVQPASAPVAAPVPAAAPTAAVETGKLAWYGDRFSGRMTASGERFNPGALTMAHKTLPFGTLVKVTNPKSGKSVILRVNDRGPSTPDRVGDVSRAAAQRLQMLRSGVIDATLEVVGQAPARGAKKS